MKAALTFSFLLIPVFMFGQILSDSIVIEHVKTNEFECAIFPANHFDLLPGERFTPTREDINEAESVLRDQLVKINSEKINQSSSPVIDENLPMYLRQYFGYIDKEGNRILFINGFWKKDDLKKDWLYERISVLDGGSYYWNIKFNLKTGKLFDLRVNGYG